MKHTTKRALENASTSVDFPDQYRLSDDCDYSGTDVTFTGIGATVLGATEDPIPVDLGTSVADSDVRELTSFAFVNGHFVGGTETNGDFVYARGPLDAELADSDPVDILNDELQRQRLIRRLGLQPLKLIGPEHFDTHVTWRGAKLSALAVNLLGRTQAARRNNSSPVNILEQINSLNTAATILTPKYLLNDNNPYVRHHVGDTFDASSRLGRPWNTYRSATQAPPTLHYLSKSHSTWRALLAQSDAGWFAKGMLGHENSADSALALQKAFSQLMPHSPPFAPDDIVQLAHGIIPTHTAPYGDSAAQTELAATNAMTEAGISRSFADGAYPLHDPSDKKRLFNEGSKPDFSRTCDEWQVESELYGTHTAKAVPSRDGKVTYVVNEAATNRDDPQRWVATAELTDAHTTPLGIRSHWPDIEKIFDPPIDYRKDRRGYGDRTAHKTPFEKFVNRSLGQLNRRNTTPNRTESSK